MANRLSVDSLNSIRGSFIATFLLSFLQLLYWSIEFWELQRAETKDWKLSRDGFILYNIYEIW